MAARSVASIARARLTSGSASGAALLGSAADSTTRNVGDPGPGTGGGAAAPVASGCGVVARYVPRAMAPRTDTSRTGNRSAAGERRRRRALDCQEGGVRADVRVAV